VSYAEKGNCGGVQDEVLPWILSKHPYSLEPCPQLGEDGITLSPFAVQLYEIHVQLEVSLSHSNVSASRADTVSGGVEVSGKTER